MSHALLLALAALTAFQSAATPLPKADGDRPIAADNVPSGLAPEAAALAVSGQSTRPVVHTIDPLVVPDDDFERHRKPAEWIGLKVLRVEFTEEGARWRLWLIEPSPRRVGPLWFVPHDNENAAFDAALSALRAYGGVVIAVDSGTFALNDGARDNTWVAYGNPVDPNRNFFDYRPAYVGAVLAGMTKAWPIFALHTNAPGFHPNASTCPALPEDIGMGDVSVNICHPVYIPSKSRARAWPFEDADTLVLTAHSAHTSSQWTFCGDALVAADFNVIFERVATSDGSLSNYALFNGIAYLNFETRNRGNDPQALAEGRNRLLHMIDRAMKLCWRTRM